MLAADPYCAGCGRILSGVDWQVDHIKPLYKGGKDSPDNRQLLCSECHEAKTVKDMGYARRVIGVDGYPVDP